jgi:hypothetical protein
MHTAWNEAGDQAEVETSKPEVSDMALVCDLLCHRAKTVTSANH